ncbi:enoyl-CoA hydratase/isomerase family protein [Tepidiforma thermophila]|uniref:Enoyl-CoA hydratase/3-hydroxypropionyl-coenzyme A dehydratase n=1 Tax=Tepidiforma thermophila (strain KCTC 52669 / CGMCC 1.13589 / G233) TaxID=2761530 RepID=A0A2A9HB55_TEPT2|nr:enoyl-CoA hydratase/isomerase family protein [Tepidiforma thermophila]PFG72988.1 enoyl-CoA hydratase/3-hydroxypropionyl-coenzyme A dehydratase [Tepidiforma thermophila]
MTDPVRFEIDPRGIATITLDRPERLNAINLRMRDLLWEYLAAAAAIPEVRAILFRGEGRTFSAGADISEFGTAPSIMAARRARHDRDIWWQLLTHRCVTIARMHGYCYGAGLELPLFCDLRIASADARLALPEVSLAYIPSAGGTQMLPRIAPPGVAAHLILTGEPIDAETALRWGIVDRVVPPGDLDAAVEAALAAALADPAAARARRLRLLGVADTAEAGPPLP